MKDARWKQMRHLARCERRRHRDSKRGGNRDRRHVTIANPESQQFGIYAQMMASALALGRAMHLTKKKYLVPQKRG